MMTTMNHFKLFFVFSLALLQGVASQSEPPCNICDSEGLNIPGNWHEKFPTAPQSCGDLHRLGKSGYIKAEDCVNLQEYLSNSAVATCNCIKAEGGTVDSDLLDSSKDNQEDGASSSPILGVQTFVSLATLAIAAYFC